jgi:hypothetical protein
MICERHYFSSRQTLRAFLAIVSAEPLLSEHSKIGSIMRGSLRLLRKDGADASTALKERKQHDKGSELAVLPAAPRR